MVNETLARRYLANDAVGRSLDAFDASRRIVGVVADVRDAPAAPIAEPAFWLPVAQVPFRTMSAAIRADQEPSALVPVLRSALASLDPELPIANLRTLSDIADAALAERRFALWWTEAFAGLALVLAALGIYALLASSVQQRHREIAIRMALGATRTNIAGRILAGGLTLAAVGSGAGALVAPAAGGALASLLYGVSPTDALALLAAPCAVVLLAGAACLGPAWAAVRAEPVAALRE